MVALTVAVLGSGCGAEPEGSSDGDPVAAGGTTPEERAALEELEASRAVDPRIAAEDANAPDPTKFAFSQELVLTDDGPRPATVVAIIDEPLVVRNEGTAPIALEFTNGVVGAEELTSTPAIEPGATYTITPVRAVSVRYRYAGRPEVSGAIQVDTGDFAG